jgi:hypothetical protein
MPMRTQFRIAIILCGWAVAAPAHGALTQAAAADTCGPTFLQVYDFQVGDVFQDRQTSGSTGGAGITSSTAVYRKYAIVSRERLPNGFRYGISGLLHQVYTHKSSMLPSVPPEEEIHSYSEIRETWEFPDTAAHRLNACLDRMIKLPSRPDYPDPVYTRVKIAVGDKRAFPLSSDTTRIKILGNTMAPGSDGNLYSDPDGKIPLTVAFSYSEGFAAGLGRVRSDVLNGESRASFQLDGCIRGKESLGGISPDETFLPPTQARIPARAAARETEPILRARAGWYFLSQGGSGYRDVKGAGRMPIQAASLRPIP